MLRTLAMLLPILMTVACASAPETIEVTQAGKGDSLAGMRYSWDVSDERFSWYRDRTGTTVPQHEVSVRYRANDKIALTGQIVYFDPWRYEGETLTTPNFTYDDILDLSVESLDPTVTLGFVMFDYSQYWVDGKVRQYDCPYLGGHTSLYLSAAFDFAREELTINGEETVSFAACGIDLKAAEALDSGRWSVATLVTPMIAVGNFEGAYGYRFHPTVR